MTRSLRSHERGAVLVEAAMAFPILFLVVFAIVEFGLQFKDSLAVSNAVRAGVRAASADPRDPTSNYNNIAVAAVTAGQTAVGSSTPLTMWVYKADPTTGYAVGDSPAGSFTSCTYCEIYTWDTTASPAAWKCTSGCTATAPYYAQSWTGTGQNSAQYTCLSSPNNTFSMAAGTHTGGTNDPLGANNQYAGPDSIGIYLKIAHKNITGFFGSTKTISDHAVGRLEPVALTQSCFG